MESVQTITYEELTRIIENLENKLRRQQQAVGDTSAHIGALKQARAQLELPLEPKKGALPK